MNAAIEARLAQVTRLQAAGGYAIRPPAPPDAIDALMAAIQQEFGVALPDGLREFWSRHDGLWWDDYKLWRVVPAPGQGWPEDVLQESRTCRTDLGVDYVALGGSSMDLYGLDCGASCWTVSSRDGVDVVESFAFDDFDGFFARLLQIVANDPPSGEAELLRQTYGTRP